MDTGWLVALLIFGILFGISIICLCYKHYRTKENNTPYNSPELFNNFLSYDSEVI